MSDGKRHLRVLHPSMSTAGLLLVCQWPWGRTVSSEPLEVVGEKPSEKSLAVYSPPRVVSDSGNALSETPEANYGSAIHEVLAARIVDPPKKIKKAKVAAKWGITDSDEQAAFIAHADEAVDTFITWMVKKNPWGIDLTRRAKIRTEMSIAYNVEKNTARLAVAPTADTHEYKGIEVGELPGTADVVIDEIDRTLRAPMKKEDVGDLAARLAEVPDLIVIDHKTGDGWAMPNENAQLKSLALANAVRVNAKSAAVGIFHTSTEESSTMFIDEIDREEIKEFRVKLKTAWKRIGDGSLNPGFHCGGCPAISICPAHAGAIMQIETGLVMTPERVGEIAMKLSAFQAAGEKIEAEIKAWIKAYGLPSGDKTRAVPLPSGKWYRTKPTKRAGWQVSTKALREVFGVEEAERLIAALKKAGHLKDSEYDDWRVVNDT